MLNRSKLIRSLFIAGLIVTSSCEEGSNNRTDDDYKLDRILNYQSSTSEQPYNFLKKEYDNNGNLTKESLINFPETLTTYTLYEYSGNKQIKKSFYDGTPDNLVLGTYITYQYSGSKVSKEELFTADGTPIHTTYYKYSGDNLIETFKVSEDLGIHHHYKYTYNNSGKVTEERVFMYDGELEEFTKYFYDERGRLSRLEMYDHTSSLTSMSEKKYDGVSALPSEEWFMNASEVLINKHLFIYDSYDNLIETDILEDGVSNALFKKKFEENRMIEEITYAPFNGFEEWTVSRFEYSKK